MGTQRPSCRRLEVIVIRYLRLLFMGSPTWLPADLITITSIMPSESDEQPSKFRPFSSVCILINDFLRTAVIIHRVLSKLHPSEPPVAFGCVCIIILVGYVPETKVSKSFYVSGDHNVTFVCTPFLVTKVLRAIY